jgi:MarR-like DNA-binding transcriptional regulator SgrR of sgrS sRNA
MGGNNMTVDEFEIQLDRLVQKYMDNPSSGTADDIAWLLENTAKHVREGTWGQEGEKRGS